MFGLDYLAFAHKNFPWKKSIALLPPGWALGVFDDPFGPVVNRVRNALLQKEIPIVRIHAHYATKTSGKTLIPLDKLKKKLPKYEELAQEFKGRSRIYVSHSCEYESSDGSAIQQRVNLIRDLAPSCVPVNSVFRGATAPDVITERHGKDAKAKQGEIISADGDNLYDLDVKKWIADNSKSLITFLWGYRFNMREINDPEQTIPGPKDRKATPSPTYTKSIIKLADNIGEPPVVLSAKPLPKGSIYKTHAEDEQDINGTEKPRENRPVLILPFHSQAVKILTVNGILLGKLIRSGPDLNGMGRYYSGLPGGINLYGVEIAEFAKKKSNSEFICFRCGDKVYGPIHPAFRAGAFR